MKALMMILTVAVTFSATASHAEQFCMKKYMEQMNLHSNKGNFYTHSQKQKAPGQQSTGSGSAPVNLTY